MRKTSEFLIGLAVAGAAFGAYYILTRDKKTEVGEDPTEDVIGKIEAKATEAKELVEDEVDYLVKTTDNFVEEAKDKVEEVTKDVVNRISRELAKANNYDIPPYEISHDTYVVPMGTWKKATVFYDNDKFHGIYGEEYKPFVLGQDNIDHFINDELSVMYIRNENLECDYAVYKGEENGEN